MDEVQKPYLFQKGKSGNPKGKPKGTLSKSNLAIKEILEKYVKWESLAVKLCDQAMEGNTMAAKLLLEYRWGKPQQTMTLEGGYTVTHEGFDGRFNHIFGAVQAQDATVSDPVVN